MQKTADRRPKTNAASACEIVHRGGRLTVLAPTTVSGSAVCSLRSAVFILCLAQSLFLRGQALAGEAGSGFPASSASSSLEMWLRHLVWLLGAVYLAVKLIKESKPSPPNYKQFASLDHRHSSLVHVSQYSDQIKACKQERLDIRQEMGGQTAKLERQMDHLRNTITTQHDQLMARLDDFNAKNDERIGHVYETIKPLAPAIAANTATINNHLADHRAGKAGK